MVLAVDAGNGSHGGGGGRVAPRKTLADPAMEEVGRNSDGRCWQTQR